MKTTSWILLTLVGALTLLGSTLSAFRAYRGLQDRIGGVEVRALGAGREEVVAALRARRGTAAAYAAGFSTLFLLVVLGPYRRGDAWSWWALLVSTLVLTLWTLARIPMLGTEQGSAAATIQFTVVVLALLLDVRRLRSPGGS